MSNLPINAATPDKAAYRFLLVTSLLAFLAVGLMALVLFTTPEVERDVRLEPHSQTNR